MYIWYLIGPFAEDLTELADNLGGTNVEMHTSN